jgi:hypothetical protein
MKYIRRFGVAIVTFVIGVAISPIHFFGESIACGLHSSSTSYRSSYFIQVSNGYREFDSAEEAEEAFNQRLSRAAQVVEVGPKVDKDGTVTGRRAVTMYYFPQESRYFTKIFWTHGRYLYSISSGSALHASEFEKQMR